MIAAYPYCKLFHYVGLIIWMGSIPIQALLFHIVSNAASADERRRAAGLLSKVSKFQVRLPMTVAIIAGVGMLQTSMLALWALPWMKLKIGLVAVLVLTEIFVVQPAIAKLGKLYAADPEGSATEKAAATLATRIRVAFAMYALGYPTVLFLVISRGDFHIYMIGAAVFGVAFVAFVRYLLHRASPAIAKELLDG